MPSYSCRWTSAAAVSECSFLSSDSGGSYSLGSPAVHFMDVILIKFHVAV